MSMFTCVKCGNLRDSDDGCVEVSSIRLICVECADEVEEQGGARSAEHAPESEAVEAAKRIIQHKTHPDLPGNWRSRKLRYGSYALEVELPCINGLSAWFSVATFHEADEAERLMTDGARQEASEYASKFASLSRVETAREEMKEECAKVAERAQSTIDRRSAQAALNIAQAIRSLSVKWF